MTHLLRPTLHIPPDRTSVLPKEEEDKKVKTSLARFMHIFSFGFLIPQLRKSIFMRSCSYLVKKVCCTSVNPACGRWLRDKDLWSDDVVRSVAVLRGIYSWNHFVFTCECFFFFRICLLIFFFTNIEESIFKNCVLF